MSKIEIEFWSVSEEMGDGDIATHLFSTVQEADDYLSLYVHYECNEGCCETPNYHKIIYDTTTNEFEIIQNDPFQKFIDDPEHYEVDYSAGSPEEK